MTSQKFGANAAWLRYGVIAMNLLEAMKILFPSQVAVLHALSRPSTIRRRVIQVAGRFVRHAGKLMLLLSGGLAPVFDAIVEAARVASG